MKKRFQMHEMICSRTKALSPMQRNIWPHAK